MLAALAALGMGLAACGGGSPKASPDSAGPPAPSKAQMLRFAACMRSHGITGFPDPTVMPNGQVGFNIQSSGNSDLNPMSPQYRAARQACLRYVPGRGKLTPAQQAADEARAVKYAECMRSHGEPQFPDPNGQGLIQIINPTGILEPSSPQYEKAQSACQSLSDGVSMQTSSRSQVGGRPGNSGSAPAIGGGG
jgi:hypothetical protein